MESQSRQFKQNARRALADKALQKALEIVPKGFISKRQKAVEGLAEFDQLRDIGCDIKQHSLAHLDLYLQQFEHKVREAGGHVHWAREGGEACSIIANIARQAGAQIITKGKSMVSEEVGLNGFLEQKGFEVVETDLGEYIIQLRGEAPSHIVAPAVHLRQSQIEADFRKTHRALYPNRDLSTPDLLVKEARHILREKFLAADIGITGANFLIAETGSSVIVTNEGNGDLTQTLPKIHIVLASIEKIVPTLSDCNVLLRLLARSATGQGVSSYTTFSTGSKRGGDLDGPGAYHVVLLDNGRSDMVGGDFHEMLRCIRCGACLNHCPIYQAVGGHSYGWVYPGPMGAVLTPQLTGIHAGHHLPNASSFCGRCEEVCPMKIPLPKMMRHWREIAFERGETSLFARFNLTLWAWLVKRPKLYRQVMRPVMVGVKVVTKMPWVLKMLPGSKNWLHARDLAVPEGGTFIDQFHKRDKVKQKEICTDG